MLRRPASSLAAVPSAPRARCARRRLGRPGGRAALGAGAEDAPVAGEERLLGQRREPAAALAEARRCTARPAASEPTGRPSTSTTASTSGVSVARRSSSKPGPDDERARVQRVRRDEGDHRRVETPDEHRAAVGEVVGGRAGRRRADQPVAGLGAELLAVERVGELDDPPGDAADDDGVVDAPSRRCRRARPRASAARRTAYSPAKTRAMPCSSSPPAIEARKPTRPKLTPITGTPLPRKRRQRAQHRPVAAERDRDLGARARPRPPRRRGRARPRRLPATARRRSSACVDVVGHAVGDDASPAQPTASSIHRSSSAGSSGSLGVDEVEDELTVSLGARQPRVYDARDAGASQRAARPRRARAGRAAAPPGRGRRPCAPRRGAPRTAA